jgi:hypothetical protein
MALYKERVANLNELADAAEVFYIDITPKAELLVKHLTPEALPAPAARPHVFVRHFSRRYSVRSDRPRCLASALRLPRK